MNQIRSRYLVAFVVLCLVVVIPLVVRTFIAPEAPVIEIIGLDGATRSVLQSDLDRLMVLERRGTYQNQFFNWRDEGVYRGVLLSDLLGGAAYETAVVVASDGYRSEIPRDRIEDPEYPMILALSFDGLESPEWADGPRIAVLPEDGDVSNEEYDAVSAGSFWVKNVARIVLE